MNITIKGAAIEGVAPLPIPTELSITVTDLGSHASVRVKGLGGEGYGSFDAAGLRQIAAVAETAANQLDKREVNA